MTTRTIDDRDGKPVEIEIDEYPPSTIDKMIEILTLAKQIYDDRDKARVFELPPYKPVKRKKKPQ